MTDENEKRRNFADRYKKIKDEDRKIIFTPGSIDGLSMFNTVDAQETLLNGELPQIDETLKNEHVTLYDAINKFNISLKQAQAAVKNTTTSVDEYIKGNPVIQKDLNTAVTNIAKIIHEYEEKTKLKSFPVLVLFPNPNLFSNMFHTARAKFTTNWNRIGKKRPYAEEPTPDEVNALKNPCTIYNCSPTSIKKSDSQDEENVPVPKKVEISNKAFLVLLGSDAFRTHFKIKEDKKGNTEYIFDSKDLKDDFLKALQKMRSQEQKEHGNISQSTGDSSDAESDDSVLPRSPSP